MTYLDYLQLAEALTAKQSVQTHQVDYKSLEDFVIQQVLTLSQTETAPPTEMNYTGAEEF